MSTACDFVERLTRKPSLFGRAADIAKRLDKGSSSEWHDGMLFYTFSDGTRAAIQHRKHIARGAVQHARKAWVLE